MVLRGLWSYQTLVSLQIVHRIGLTAGKFCEREAKGKIARAFPNRVLFAFQMQKFSKIVISAKKRSSVSKIFSGNFQIFSEIFSKSKGKIVMET